MSRNYVGSIRFYKNLILLVVVLAIGISAGLAIHNGRRAAAAEKSLQALRTQGAVEVPFGEVGDNAPAYQSLYPDFYAEKPYGARERESGVVYLTFEGGPSERTDEILTALRDRGVKATFFVTGTGAGTPSYDAHLQAILDGGHTLGMYSWCGEYLTIYKSVEGYLADMYTLFSYIKEATGVTPTVFRFPGGSVNAYNTALYQQLVAEMVRRGFVPCDWNISCGDSGADMLVEELAENVMDNISMLDRAVIQMHDTADNTVTVEALPRIIDELKNKSFRFAALTPETKPVIFSYLTDATNDGGKDNEQEREFQ